MADSVPGTPHVCELDDPLLESPRDPAKERRGCPRARYFALKRIAPYDGSRMPDEAEFFCVEFRDLTDNGMSFFLQERPDFDSVVLMSCDSPGKNHTVARVAHCTDVLVYPSGLIEPIDSKESSRHSRHQEGENGERMVLVGCQFVSNIK